MIMFKRKIVIISLSIFIFIIIVISIPSFSNLNDIKQIEEYAESLKEPAKTEQIHQGYSNTAPQYEVDGNIVSNVDATVPSWNPREKSQEQIEERAAFLAGQYDIVRTEAQQKRADEAREKYSDAIVINALLPSSVGIVVNTPEHFEKALKRNIDAGITVISASVFSFLGDGQTSPPERILASAKVMETLDLGTVSDTESIRQAKADGKMIVMFNSQRADYYIDDLEMLEQLKLMMMHVANFVYNSNNALAGGVMNKTWELPNLAKSLFKKQMRLELL